MAVQTGEETINVSKMLAEGWNIKYTVLKKGTVLPNGIMDNAISNHAYTWRVKTPKS